MQGGRVAFYISSEQELTLCLTFDNVTKMVRIIDFAEKSIILT